MKIEILKDKMDNGKVHIGYKIENHGFRGHPPVLENWFATEEGFEKNLLHYIGQYIGRKNKTEKGEKR
jgi:hypothetical protein